MKGAIKVLKKPSKRLLARSGSDASIKCMVRAGCVLRFRRKRNPKVGT